MKRLNRLVPPRLEKNVESKKKSAYKALSWRIIATLTTGTIGYFVTGSFAIAGSIMTFDFFIKMILYYYHERAWSYYE